MNVVVALGALAAALLISGAAVALLARVAWRLPQATPNERSLHVRPVPRAGGYAIWAGFLPAALLFPPAVPGALVAWLPAWLLLVVVSARDDASTVSVAVRLLAHLAAAVWCAAWMLTDRSAFDAGALASVALLALAFAWSANLYNFMDGSDGLAATMAFCGFGAYGVAASGVGAPSIAYFALSVATLPFLVVNRPRATMFLGDVGSVPLGFLAAAFGAGGTLSGQWPAWFPLLVFLPFIADATVTLARRALRGERLWSAHKDHYYQRLLRLGAGHGGTLAAYTAAMAGTTATALACLAFAPAWGILALASWCVVCFILFAAIDYRWRRQSSASR